MSTTRLAGYIIQSWLRGHIDQAEALRQLQRLQFSESESLDLLAQAKKP